MMVNQTKRAASVDIGTNSVLMLVAEIDGKTIRVLDERQAVPRLGKGVDAGRTLHPDSVNRVMEVLSDYKIWLSENYPDLVESMVVTATSAVRDAMNRREFLDRIETETGWKVRLLSGDEEARCTYHGAISVLPDTENLRCVLDIGGGSTEVAYGRHGIFEKGVSLDIGSVRFSERYLTSNPPSTEEINRARAGARQAFEAGLEMSVVSSTEAVGVAGTVTSVAAIELGLDGYNPEELNNFTLHADVISRFILEFLELKSDRIEEKYPLFLSGRGDVILSGLIILEEFLKWLGSDCITVSTGGIRHGILMD